MNPGIDEGSVMRRGIDQPAACVAAGSGRQGVRVCFSPEADLAGGVIITVIGLDAVRHIDHRRYSV